jgi:hypothetical protein
MADSKESDGSSITAKDTGITAADSLRDDAAAQRIAFLSSFSPEEDKAIRRKVDWRFLWLIGLMYIIKNVCESAWNVIYIADVQPTRKCYLCQSSPGRKALEHFETIAYDFGSVQLGSIYLLRKEPQICTKNSAKFSKISFIAFEVPTSSLKRCHHETGSSG